MPRDLKVIVISGGWPGGPVSATGGGHHWQREADELETAFIERVQREAEALGVWRVVIGGLPD